MIVDYKSEKYYIGAEFKTNEGHVVKIVGKSNRKGGYYFVEFQDEHKSIVEFRCDQISKGSVKNPCHRTIYGVGYFGVGGHLSVCKSAKRNLVKYDKWRGMIRRCYSGEKEEYENVSVCKEWHNYQNYAEWFEENYIEGCHMDKDLLQLNSKYKVYSPNTCIFLPVDINSFFTNVQKTNTSGHIGVHFDSVKNAYIAQINIEGVQTYLGTKKTAYESSCLYKAERLNQSNRIKDKMIKLGYGIDIVALVK